MSTSHKRYLIQLGGRTLGSNASIEGAAHEGAVEDHLLPFCACGRRWSDCDGSRRGCVKRFARSVSLAASK